MSLSDVLKFRYPVVWLNTTESERYIVTLTSVIEDRILYVYDDFEGLTVWDEEAKDFKIITIEAKNPYDPEAEPNDVPITDFGQAFNYAYQKGSQAVFVIRNFHKGVENYFNPIASLYNKYYRTIRFDDIEPCPLTVMCLSAEPEVPPELASMVTVENFGFPTESALVELLSYIAEKVPVENAIDGQNIGPMAKACRGMSEFDVLTTVFNLIHTQGEVKPEEIDRIKYERLKASSTLEIVKPRFGLEDIGGLDHAKDIVYKADYIRRHPEEAAAKGVKPINKMLLLGLPGGGKSMICEGASKTQGLDLAKIGVSKVMTKWIGESERKMRETWQQIHALAPIACWIDELGRDFQGGDHDGGTTNRVHGEMLTGLQELPDNVALFAAANDISSLPPEMLRAERFDKILFVGYPSWNERQEIFKINLGTDSDYDWEILASATGFFTGAEIVQLINTTRFDRLLEPGVITTRNLVDNVINQKNRLWIRHHDRVKFMYRIAMDEHEWASTEQREEAPDVLRGVAQRSKSVAASAPRGITLK